MLHGSILFSQEGDSIEETMMSKKYVLAIDQGTTSSKVMVMDSELNLVAEHATPFEQHFPAPGWVEHDLNQIWQSVITGIQAVVKQVDINHIVSIGITNQRETICFWDKLTTEPLSRALVWQDRRTGPRCEQLKSEQKEAWVQEKTGLLLDPYFSATKIEWMLKNNETVRNASSNGTLAIGTIDSFLLAKFTHGKVHATEPSNASRTLLYNIDEEKWDQELLALFDIQEKDLPKVQNSFGLFGVVESVPGLKDGTPIGGMIGDQQSALLGQACIEVGQAKCTYGTGAFLLMNTGKTRKKSNHRLLSTIAWRDLKGETTYALEGSAFMAGATIQWLRDGLQIIKKSSEVESLAASVESSEGVMFVPSFTGLGAPHWNSSARAALTGLTRGSTKAHIARAALEGIAFQNCDLLFAMEKDLGAKLIHLNVDGGACKNNLLMQIQADFLGCRLKRPVFTETTSLGAIFAAGLGVGLWNDLCEIKKVWKLEQEFSPKINEQERTTRLAEWAKSVNKL